MSLQKSLYTTFDRSNYFSENWPEMFFKVILIVIAKPLYLLSLGIKVCSVNHYCAFSAKGLHLVCKHRWMPSLMETNFLLNLVLGDLLRQRFLNFTNVFEIMGRLQQHFLYFCISVFWIKSQRLSLCLP